MHKSVQLLYSSPVVSSLCRRVIELKINEFFQVEAGFAIDCTVYYALQIDGAKVNFTILSCAALWEWWHRWASLQARKVSQSLDSYYRKRMTQYKKPNIQLHSKYIEVLVKVPRTISCTVSREAIHSKSSGIRHIKIVD
jgi:hypothetical protein